MRRFLKNAGQSLVSVLMERKVRRRMLAVVLCVGVFITTIDALTMQGITMAKDTVCGMEEHVHDGSCYQTGEDVLICGLEENDEHAHDAGRYEEGSSELVCNIPEHIHNDSCYAAETEGDSESSSESETVEDIQNDADGTDDAQTAVATEEIKESISENIEEVKAGLNESLLSLLADEVTEESASGINEDPSSLETQVNLNDEHPVLGALEESFMNLLAIPRRSLDTTSVSVQPEAKKLLDGDEPGENYFNFALYDSEYNEIAQAENDEDGNISFPELTFSSPGKYTYYITEMNDGQNGIDYDDSIYTLNVQVSQKDLMDLDADAYYSVQGSDQVYYISSAPGSTDFPVYCIDQLAEPPSSVSDERQAYRLLVDPDGDELANYVTENRWGDELSEKLRQLFYYLDTHPEWGFTEVQKKTIVWALVGNYNKNYDGDWGPSQFDFNKVFAVQVPDSYHLVVFVPDGYDRSSQTRVQPLAAGYGPKLSFSLEGSEGQAVFKNTRIDESKLVYGTITARKLLDGQVPGDKRFNFILRNERGNIVRRAQNDSQGNIVFPQLTFSEAGTYKYTIEEENDRQSGISYDYRVFDAVIKVTESTYVKPDTNRLTGVSYEGNQYFVQYNGSLHTAYCLNKNNMSPDSSVTYSYEEDPSDRRIWELIHDSSVDLDKLKRVVYYLMMNPTEFSNSQEQHIVWVACNFTGRWSDETLKQNAINRMNYILEKVTSIPENFHVVVYEPSDYSLSANPFTVHQPLIFGYMSGDAETTITLEGTQADATFENTTVVPTGYRLPETGGSGAVWFYIAGVLALAAGTGMSIWGRVKRRERSESR